MEMANNTLNRKAVEYFNLILVGIGLKRKKDNTGIINANDIEDAIEL